MVLFFPHFLCFSFTLSVLFNCLCMRLNVLPVVFNPLISMLISFLYFHKRRIQLKDPVVWLPQFAKLITFDFSRMLDGTHDFSLLIFVRFFFFFILFIATSQREIKLCARYRFVCTLLWDICSIIHCNRNTCECYQLFISIVMLKSDFFVYKLFFKLRFSILVIVLAIILWACWYLQNW